MAGVRFGGQPGELATVCAGTLFYRGQRIVEDAERGIFDRHAAEVMVNDLAILSEETGNPAVVHIYATSFPAFQKYLDFLDPIWNGPLIVDSHDSGCRSRMAGLTSELGYADRIIYNSVSVAMTPEEAQALAYSEVDSAIILAFNPAEGGVDGRITLLEQGGAGMDKGLLPLAREMGINNILLDPGVAPLGSGAGESLRFTAVAKARLGLPVGSGMHNAASSWGWLRSRDREVRLCCDVAAAAASQVASGDFVLYGPIERAYLVFPVVAMVDLMVAEAVRDLGVESSGDHPIHRLV